MYQSKKSKAMRVRMKITFIAQWVLLVCIVLGEYAPSSHSGEVVRLEPSQIERPDSAGKSIHMSPHPLNFLVKCLFEASLYETETRFMDIPIFPTLQKT